MSMNKENPRDEGLEGSVVNQFAEASQWNVEVLVRFKCALPEVFGEEIIEVSDMLSASDFAGKIALIFATQIKQSGGKFLLVKKHDRSREDVYSSLKMSDVGFLRDGDVFEAHAIVSPHGQHGSTLYALVQGAPSNVNQFIAPVVLDSAHSTSVNPQYPAPSQHPYQQHQFYPPLPSAANSTGAAHASSVFFPTTYNSGFRNVPPPMHPSVSQFFNGIAVPKLSVQQQPVMHGAHPSPSSLSHSWNNSWPNHNGQNQQQILRNQLKQEVEKQKQHNQQQEQQQQQLSISSQTSLVSSVFSPPRSNLVHLFIPVHWKNYPRILHGAIEEVLDGSGLQNAQKIEVRRVLIETIVNGRVPSESIQKSTIQLPKDAIFSYLDKVKATMICVLGETQADVPPDVSSKSYMELKKRKKKAADPEAQLQNSRGVGECDVLKKVKLEPVTCDSIYDHPETVPALQESPSNADRFSLPGATSNCLVIVQGRCFHLNKGFLGVNSSAFQEWFQKQDQLEISDISAEEFQQLMDFIYPSEKQCLVTKENLETLLKLSVRFKMVEVSKRCEKFLTAGSNAIDYTLAKRLHLAQEHGLTNLKDECIKHCVSMDDLRSIQAEKEYKMLKDKTIVEIVENITRNSY